MLLIALGSSKSTDILPPWHTCIIKVTNFLLSYYQVSHTFKYVQVGSIIYPPQRRFFWKLTIIFFAPPHLKEKKKSTETKAFLLLQSAGSSSTLKNRSFHSDITAFPYSDQLNVLCVGPSGTDCLLHKKCDSLGNKTILTFTS